MAAAADDARQRELLPFGEIQIGGDQKLGPALEDDFLDLVGFALDGARDTGIERRLRGERPEAKLNVLLYCLDVRLGVGPALETGADLESGLFRAANALDKVLLDHAREAVERRQGGL